MKANIPKSTDLWRQKALAPDLFAVRLFRIQQPEQKVGLFASMFRRPSWQSPSRSPSREGAEVKVEAKHISPFTQLGMEAEGIYMLDASSQLFVLFGPLFPSQPVGIRDALLGQALHFASEYGIISGQSEDGPASVKASVLFSGVPRDLKMLFRHWNDEQGLWGTAGLMAGSRAQGGNEMVMLPLDQVLNALYQG